MDKKIFVGAIAITIIVGIYFSTVINTRPDVINETTTSDQVKPHKSVAQYIGSNSCTECHKKQSTDWKGSHHELAMQHANEKTILADFNNTSFVYFDITSRFFKKDDKYYVNTDGAEGTLKDFEIKYVFGVAPLQQYLIEFPGGRLQALGIAWDSRAKDQGGQRWYHLYPDEQVTYKDRLHWTKADQNWNYMCADCHSTNLQKKYNSDTNTYATSWSEINVGCEACHGPASGHVAWAKSNSHEQANKGLVVNLNERVGVNWNIDPVTGNAKRSEKRLANKEIEICARCHSRRSVIAQDYTPGEAFLDSYQPALLTDFLYHPDGQIKEEVYVYGSFVQSKMYHNGVTCSDCHEPHGLKLRAEGNAVCLQCHSSDKFNKPSHHFHKTNGDGARCVSCHMPQTTYMGVDARHDHSIRIPRPDLSIALKTPNACNQCHQEKSTSWANKKMQDWYGKDWAPGWHFGEALYAATGNTDTDMQTIGHDLAAVAASPKLPAIARASAARLLPNHISPTTFAVVQQILRDDDPLIRLSALSTLDNLDVQYRLKAGFKLLSDPVRSVRIEAARILSVVPQDNLTPQQQSLLNKVIEEYRQAQLVNAERPESYMNLGLLETRLRNYSKAEAAYRQALKLDPNFIHAYINLADLFRLQERDEEAEQALQQGLKIDNDNANLHHVLGLLYVRLKQMERARREFKTAWYLQKDNVRYGYVYAVALQGNGKTKSAIKILKELHRSQANDQDVLIALVTYLQQTGNSKAARLFAESLVKLNPQIGSVEEILQRLASP